MLGALVDAKHRLVLLVTRNCRLQWWFSRSEFFIFKGSCHPRKAAAG